MDALYPNLHDRFKSEGVCPICLMEMELAPRYACENGHTICYRCKPYYYACPTCRSPLNIESPPARNDSSYMPSPPPTHYMPHPLPPNYPHHPHPGNPTAPPREDGEDFINHEKHTWRPVEPLEDQELVACPFSHLGCWVKFPIHLQELHESRCQFRPNLEEATLPTDLQFGQDDLVECCYQSAGCNMRITPWRKHVHEKYCYYKDRYDAMSNVSDALGSIDIADEYSNQRYGDNEQDSEELVDCRYAMYGCKVRMYRSRRHNHESKCNYEEYGYGVDEEDHHQVTDESELDPEESVPCRWSEYGCRVQPKRYCKEDHEQKCNYRLEECVYKDYGCVTILNPSNRFAHERTCEFAC